VAIERISELQANARVGSISYTSVINNVKGDIFLLKSVAELLEGGKLFSSDTEESWICLNCGHVYSGTKALEKCPVCSHEKGYFMKLEYSPYEN